jgi:hypothetical protein
MKRSYTSFGLTPKGCRRGQAPAALYFPLYFTTKTSAPARAWEGRQRVMMPGSNRSYGLPDTIMFVITPEDTR